MANDYFCFRLFTIRQRLCAMKVGTDGTLLGAWAEGGKRILDIGTGTGLLALMMAQRFPMASIVGIDIDADAVEQAKENASMSPFSSRVTIEMADVRNYTPGILFDSIVCNPPFFSNSMQSPDHKRSLARHSVTLEYHELLDCICRLLDEDGQFSVIVPFDYRRRMENEAIMRGLFLIRRWRFLTTPQKQPRRYLLSFAKRSGKLDEGELVLGDNQYVELMKDFYL